MTHVIERCRAAGAVEDVLVDVGTCEYMDSTMLGLLARWAPAHRQLHGRYPFLVGLGVRELARIFKRMSLDRIFETRGVDATAHRTMTAVPSLPPAPPIPCDRANQVLLAHETLAELSPENAAAFELLIALLKKETRSDAPGATGAGMPGG